VENLEAEVDALFEEADQRFFEFCNSILATIIEIE
jgi:hypothetical protein